MITNIFYREKGGLGELVSVLMIFTISFLAISTSLAARNKTNFTGPLLEDESQYSIVDVFEIKYGLCSEVSNEF